MGTAGCSTPVLLDNAGGPTSTEYSLHLQDLPDDRWSYQVVVQTFAATGTTVTGRYDNIDLGQVLTSSSVDQKVRLDSRATHVALYLVDASGTARYFDQWKLSDLADHRLIQAYWVSYFEYSTNNTVVLGVNSRSAEDLALGADQAVAFTNKPFRLFRIPSETGRTYRASYSDTGATPSRVTYAGSVSTITALSQDQTLEPSVVVSLPGQGSPGFLFVRPQDYRKSAAVSLSYTDVTAELAAVRAHTFAATAVVSLDHGLTLLMADLTDTGYHTPTPKELRRWDVATGTVELVKTFSERITAMVSNGVDLYLASGPSLFRYSGTTGRVSPLWNFGGQVVTLAALGTTHLLVSDNASYGDHISLVRLDPFAVQAEKSMVDSSLTSVWIPEQSRVYRLRDGTSPDDVCYLEVNLDAGTLGAYGDSPYHGDYSISHPLVRFGSSPILATGSGNLFRIDDPSESKIRFWTSLASPFVDLQFGTDRLWRLTSAFSSPWTVTGTTLQSQGLVPPFVALDALGNWPNERGLGLIPTADGILAVTQKIPASPYDYGENLVRFFSRAAASATDPAAVARTLSGGEAVRLWSGAWGILAEGFRSPQN